MNSEKELKQKVVGKNTTTNMLLSFKIISDLIPQILLVWTIGQLLLQTLTAQTLYRVFAAMLVVSIGKGLFSYLATRTAHDRAYTKLTDLRLMIIHHLKKLNLGFFKEHNTGELTNIIQHDVEQVEVYLAHGLPEIMSATLLPLLIFILMLFLEWRLALIMITGVPLMLLVKVLSARTMKEKFQIYFKQEMKMREELMEYVKNIAVIKAFAKEESFSERTLQTARSYVSVLKKSMGSITIPMGLIDVFMEIGVVLVMISGSVLLIEKEISIVIFILAIILSSAFISAISKTATLQHYSIVFKEALKSVRTILGAPVPSQKQHMSLCTGDIRFNDVNFKYEKEGFSLNNINLCLLQNSLNAFVGPSGCGKSTVVNLLMGFWDVRSGKITINGVNISDCSQESVSTLIASVQQEVILFNLSIFENIAIGRDGATLAEVIDAAKKARCHEFISDLPHGYDTKIGEMGVKLSGGEKQRISIARMILKNAPILVLDEAMAAVDSENERLIGEAIETLRENKTVLTIAHHLNTVQNSDQIIVMDKGEIIDTGTHDELMSRCDFYRNMVAAQNKVDNWDLKEEPNKCLNSY